MFYNTNRLTYEQKVEILRRAKAVCQHWWVDVLDCSESFCRKRVEMSFEEILEKFDDQAHFSMIHRCVPPENHLEIGFRVGAGNGPDYFLWLIVNMKNAEEFTAGLERER
jgi:hypothetical protein